MVADAERVIEEFYVVLTPSLHASSGYISFSTFRNLKGIFFLVIGRKTLYIAVQGFYFAESKYYSKIGG